VGPVKATVIAEGAERTFVLVFETGDEVIGQITQFASDQRLTAAHFVGIGALSQLTVGYFNWETKTYDHVPIAEQVEVLSLAGDIAEHRGEAAIHAHIVVGKADGSAHGGHLVDARVRPTLELVLAEAPAHLRKRYDPDTGLALIDLSESVR
jgi:predicted DNA-binding protein with PD1-like motif